MGELLPDELQRAELPGYDLVTRGLRDLHAGRRSIEAMLVAVAGTRLAAIGVQIPPAEHPMPSHALYELLSEQDDNAHSRYNALVGRIVSFARAAEHASAR